MSRRLRRLGRRPPFSVALVTLVVALTALTAATIAGLAWRDQRARSHALLAAAMEQTAGLVAGQASRFLRDAESAARLGPRLIAQRQLDPDDRQSLERFVVAVLGAHPQLSWVSYGDVRDRFVGAWRDAAGRVHVNHSFPRNGRIRLEEDRLLPDGRREVVRRSADHGYRPSQRPYFRAAETAREVTWTDPYQFYAGGGPGVTCAAPWLGADGRVQGVFTVDFSLDRLAEFLEDVNVSRRGRVLLASRDGALLASQRPPDGATRSARDADLVSAISQRLARDVGDAFGFEYAGEPYLARAVPLQAGGAGWMTQVVVPERDLTEEADAEARRGLLLGLLALGVALVGGVATARWIAWPLQELAELARRIRHGDLDVVVTARSRDEIGVLTRAMADMVRALRDREFVRETLGRYVSPDVAQRVLHDRSALRLGGEVREVAILMSDLRGFSTLSARLGPEAMIELLNRYLAAMTRVILAHGGTIDEFIGDAILVLFGAPFPHADDAERAVRCAWAMQQAMADVNAESRRLGLPALEMGIGVHVGTVVAGNIGGPDRVKYGVVGPPVNLASRIQALAGGGQVLLSETLAGRVGESVRLGAPRAAHVKGVADAVSLYPLEGLTEQRPPELRADTAAPAAEALVEAGTAP